MTHVDLKRIRDEKQLKTMREIEQAGHCPFCGDNLLLYHKEPILKETERWLLTKNQWPYKNSRVHLLAIYKDHKTHIDQIPPEAGYELFDLMRWAVQEYDMRGGAVVWRFGDTKYTGGSVSHLHAQLVTADVDAPGYEPIRFFLG
ncbi:MAG TPA: hypothetical protein VHF05_03765 [Candidatus Paceibacterota bacterium]|jgi:diadenosine tetraphosphate (Ap4A) HIT family hydrolase|nr:hypothetical protein [Candidatus Paceibacterota bacterium]